MLKLEVIAEDRGEALLDTISRVWNVVIALKTPYDDGTIHVVLSPMAFMGCLAALVPKPRMDLTRFPGVFSPNSKLREYVVARNPFEAQEIPKPKTYSMTWAQRLERRHGLIIICRNYFLANILPERSVYPKPGRVPIQPTRCISIVAEYPKMQYWAILMTGTELQWKNWYQFPCVRHSPGCYGFREAIHHPTSAV